MPSLSPERLAALVDEPPTPEEQADGYRLNGIVMLVAVFGTMTVLLIGLLLGVKALLAVVVAIVVGGLLAFNVRRVLERKFREKHPDYR